VSFVKLGLDLGRPDFDFHEVLCLVVVLRIRARWAAKRRSTKNSRLVRVGTEPANPGRILRLSKWKTCLFFHRQRSSRRTPVLANEGEQSAMVAKGFRPSGVGHRIRGRKVGEGQAIF
jgi:hypothetical protein